MNVFVHCELNILSIVECTHEGGSSVCGNVNINDNSNIVDNQQPRQQHLPRSNSSHHSGLSGQVMATANAGTLGRLGHSYYSFPQGFYHPTYTTAAVPTTGIPHSQSDSFHDRTSSFDPRRYFLPENVAQRRNRQLYDLHTTENRDNFHNFVLSGIQQHLLLQRLNPQQEEHETDANKRAASTNSDYCIDLATTDPTYSNLPGCTCTYSSNSSTKSKNKFVSNQRLQDSIIKDAMKAGVSSKFESEQEDGNALGTKCSSGGQTFAPQTSKLNTANKNIEFIAHTASSHLPFWALKDIKKRDKETAHRLSSASETDTENGVNYHIESYQTDHDILGSDAGDISALSSSQDSDLCSCGKLGLNHSHTNCSNLSTRGSSDVPSDVSSYDSNVYRSKSPAEMGHTQNEGKGPPSRFAGFALPVPRNKDYNGEHLSLKLESEMYEQADGQGLQSVANTDIFTGYLPPKRNAFSQHSIVKDSASRRQKNLTCDLSELNETGKFIPNHNVPPEKSERYCRNKMENELALTRPFSRKNERIDNLDLLLPMPTTSNKTNDIVGIYDDVVVPNMTGTGKWARQSANKYSRNLDKSISSNDTEKLSPCVSDWYQSGSESNGRRGDFKDWRRNVGAQLSTDANELTALLNHTIPVIPCSCAPYSLNFSKSDSKSGTQTSATSTKRLTKEKLDYNTNPLADPFSHGQHACRPGFLGHQQHGLQTSRPEHRTDQCKTCLSLQRITDLHRDAVQRESSVSFQRHSMCSFKDDGVYHPVLSNPTPRSLLFDDGRLNSTSYGSLSSISAADDQFVTPIPTGAADELADVCDIGTSEGMGMIAENSSSGNGEKIRAASVFKKKICSYESHQYLQPKDTIVVTNPKGRTIVVSPFYTSVKRHH